MPVKVFLESFSHLEKKERAFGDDSANSLTVNNFQKSNLYKFAKKIPAERYFVQFVPGTKSHSASSSRARTPRKSMRPVRKDSLGENKQPQLTYAQLYQKKKAALSVSAKKRRTSII